MGEALGNDASRKRSALVGAEQCDPCGVGRMKGAAVRGRRAQEACPGQRLPNVNLFGVATATGTKGKHGQGVIPLCGTQLVKPPACGRCLTGRYVHRASTSLPFWRDVRDGLPKLPPGHAWLHQSAKLGSRVIQAVPVVPKEPHFGVDML